MLIVATSTNCTFRWAGPVGVDPKHVVIGHISKLIDPNTEVHRAICRRGAYIGFDRQGGPDDEAVVPMVMSLINAGYADNLMFLSDFANGTQLKRNNKDMGYAKTLTVFLPKLKKAGASDEVLRQITHDNPRRFLAFVAEGDVAHVGHVARAPLPGWPAGGSSCSLRGRSSEGGSKEYRRT
jgi:hypothetical protein